ncbi:MAG: hypothetical protein K1060chlam1_00350 [Candidatus Anoxychlamydiales bacterium]|nr:hypothetical protein [Candidatus Anoxychlamydiales bacterium]
MPTMPKPPSDPTGASGAPKITPDKTTEKGMSPPDSSSFQAYKEEAPSAAPTAKATEMTPMDLATKAGISTTPTYQSLFSQAANAQDTLGDVQKNLQTPNLKLKKSQTDLLNTKLGNANKNLKAANQKMGANIPQDTKVAQKADPLTRFVGMVTDGQNKLNEARTTLQNLKTGQGTLQPTDMLLVQIKLAQAQQEIEYSSVLLNQVVSSLKTILGTQI